MEKKIRINMLSQATSVSGQGVGSAYMEQVSLVKENKDLFEVSENGKGHKYEIVHVHTVNPTYRFKMNKKHVNVMYVHFIPETLDGSVKLPKFIFWVFKKYVIGTYRKADEIVVVNPVFKEPLIKLGINPDNITYIPNYVSKEQFHPLPQEEIDQVKAKYGIEKDKFVVLGCGQVQTRKGVLDFVEVAKKLPSYQFVWAGGFSFGAITDGYKELKEVMDNPPANVKFIGIVERSEMNTIFNMSDALFMPSFSELFPMSILEAVNSYKPVVLRDLDLYRDILFEKYEKANSVDEWVDIFNKLKDDPEYLNKAKENSKYIAEFYSKEHVNDIWREYYPRIYEKYKKLGTKKFPKDKK
jgi:1,2-diacylglycerol-3-alpha-glucose alpha-1,2-galactosyltransferase